MTEKKKKIDYSEAWIEAKELIWQYRFRLLVGAVLMVFNRLVGLILPASSKYVIDEVIVKQRNDLLLPLALVGGAATIAQAISSFALSQVLGVAAQGAITDMRKQIMEQVLRLPIRYFDSMKSGKLIARVMNDAEGVRNLVGTGVVQLVGGIMSALIALCVLFYLNWHLTSITILVLATFGGGIAYAFNKLRPMFRERNEIYSDITGRLAETIGGIRTVKAYTAEKREELIFARGAHKFLRNVARSMTAVSATMASTTVIIGVIGVLADKDAPGMLAELAGSLEAAVFTGLPGEALAAWGRPGARAWDPEELQGLAGQLGLEAETARTPARALERAREMALEKGGAVIITGSHFLLAPDEGAGFQG